MSGNKFYEILEEFERKMIICALVTANGNLAEASNALGLNRTTLLAKTKAKGIDVNQFRPWKESYPPRARPEKKHTHGWTAHKMMLILQTLQKHNWNRTHTANELGISIRMLRHHIAEMRAKGADIPESPNHPNRYKLLT